MHAVRGEIVLLAQKMKKELGSGKEYPFKKIVMCNIGNPQQLGQKPITFFRQVLALCDYPQVGWRRRLLDTSHLPSRMEHFAD